MTTADLISFSKPLESSPGQKSQPKAYAHLRVIYRNASSFTLAVDEEFFECRPGLNSDPLHWNPDIIKTFLPETFPEVRLYYVCRGTRNLVHVVAAEFHAADYDPLTATQMIQNRLSQWLDEFTQKSSHHMSSSSSGFVYDRRSTRCQQLNTAAFNHSLASHSQYNPLLTHSAGARDPHAFSGDIDAPRANCGVWRPSLFQLLIRLGDPSLTTLEQRQAIRQIATDYLNNETSVETFYSHLGQVVGFHLLAQIQDSLCPPDVQKETADPRFHPPSQVLLAPEAQPCFQFTSLCPPPQCRYASCSSSGATSVLDGVARLFRYYPVVRQDTALWNATTFANDDRVYLIGGATDLDTAEKASSQTCTTQSMAFLDTKTMSYQSLLLPYTECPPSLIGHTSTPANLDSLPVCLVHGGEAWATPKSTRRNATAPFDSQPSHASAIETRPSISVQSVDSCDSSESITLNTCLYGFEPSLKTWKILDATASNRPPPRHSHAALVHPSPTNHSPSCSSRYFIIFGGRGFPCGNEVSAPSMTCSTTKLALLNDLWSFDLRTFLWRQIDVPLAPSPRCSMQFAWVNHATAMLYGGQISNPHAAKLGQSTAMLSNEVWYATIGESSSDAKPLLSQSETTENPLNVKSEPSLKTDIPPENEEPTANQAHALGESIASNETPPENGIFPAKEGAFHPADQTNSLSGDAPMVPTNCDTSSISSQLRVSFSLSSPGPFPRAEYAAIALTTCSLAEDQAAQITHPPNPPCSDQLTEAFVQTLCPHQHAKWKRSGLTACLPSELASTAMTARIVLLISGKTTNPDGFIAPTAQVLVGAVVGQTPADFEVVWKWIDAVPAPYLPVLSSHGSVEPWTNMSASLIGLSTDRFDANVADGDPSEVSEAQSSDHKAFAVVNKMVPCVYLFGSRASNHGWILSLSDSEPAYVQTQVMADQLFPLKTMMSKFLTSFCPSYRVVPSLSRVLTETLDQGSNAYQCLVSLLSPFLKLISSLRSDPIHEFRISDGLLPPSTPGLLGSLSTLIKSPLTCFGNLLSNALKDHVGCQNYAVSLTEWRSYPAILVVNDGNGLSLQAFYHLATQFGPTSSGLRGLLQKQTSYGLGFKLALSCLAHHGLILTKTPRYYGVSLCSLPLNAMMETSSFVAPLVVWSTHSHRPLLQPGQTHVGFAQSVRLILNYTPLRSVEGLSEEFDTFDSGTKLIFFGLRQDIPHVDCEGHVASYMDCSKIPIKNASFAFESPSAVADRTPTPQPSEVDNPNQDIDMLTVEVTAISNSESAPEDRPQKFSLTATFPCYTDASTSIDYNLGTYLFWSHLHNGCDMTLNSLALLPRRERSPRLQDPSRLTSETGQTGVADQQLADDRYYNSLWRYLQRNLYCKLELPYLFEPKFGEDDGYGIIGYLNDPFSSPTETAQVCETGVLLYHEGRLITRCVVGFPLLPDFIRPGAGKPLDGGLVASTHLSAAINVPSFLQPRLDREGFCCEHDIAMQSFYDRLEEVLVEYHKCALDPSQLSKLQTRYIENLDLYRENKWRLRQQTKGAALTENEMEAKRRLDHPDRKRQEPSQPQSELSPPLSGSVKGPSVQGFSKSKRRRRQQQQQDHPSRGERAVFLGASLGGPHDMRPSPVPTRSKRRPTLDPKEQEQEEEQGEEELEEDEEEEDEEDDMEEEITQFESNASAGCYRGVVNEGDDPRWCAETRS